MQLWDLKLDLGISRAVSPTRLVWPLVLIALTPFGLTAADCYIRAGGTGTASCPADWSVARDDLPATLTRGNTYYVADGNYGNYTFNDAASGSTLITIKKAIVADHGTETGWLDTYGDGQAVFSVLLFDQPYYTFDGVTGGGPGSWKTNFGFKITTPTAGTKLIRIDQPATNITIRHTELAHRGTSGPDTADDGLYIGVPVGGNVTNITVSYCYLHDFRRVPVLTRRLDGMVFEYCWVARNESTAAQHSEAWSGELSDNVTIRYSVWEDIEGTGVILMGADNPTGTDSHGWEIYGNVFVYTPTSDRSGITNGIIGSWAGYNVTNVKIYNNAFINFTKDLGGARFGFFASPGGTVVGVEARNNIWIAGTNANHIGVNTLSHNSYYDTATTDSGTGTETGLTGDPLVDWVNENYHLLAATTAGTTLLSPYDTDSDGNTRGADGTWDRGAFEFGGTASLSPPPNLRAIVR